MLFRSKWSVNDREYREVREEMKNGDVLLFRGRNLASRAVQWATRSRYSHAGIVAWWNDRLMVMEAVGRGVSVTPISASVGHYHGSVEWFQSRDPIGGEERLAMVKFAQQELGKSYALWNSILLGVRILLDRDQERRDALRRERSLFCSSYVAQVYNSIGRDLKQLRSDRFMSPADIADSPLLQRMAVLRKRRQPESGESRQGSLG